MVRCVSTTFSFCYLLLRHHKKQDLEGEKRKKRKKNWHDAHARAGCHETEGKLTWAHGHCCLSMIKSTAKNSILLLEFFVALEGLHQPGTGVVGSSQLLDLTFQGVDMVFCALPNGSLRFAIICSLPFELCCSQGGHTASACTGRPSLGSWTAGLWL
jgi:hypothetical protein